MSRVEFSLWSSLMIHFPSGRACFRLGELEPWGRGGWTVPLSTLGSLVQGTSPSPRPPEHLNQCGLPPQAGDSNQRLCSAGFYARTPEARSLQAASVCQSPGQGKTLVECRNLGPGTEGSSDRPWAALAAPAHTGVAWTGPGPPPQESHRKFMNRRGPQAAAEKSVLFNVTVALVFIL